MLPKFWHLGHWIAKSFSQGQWPYCIKWRGFQARLSMVWSRGPWTWVWTRPNLQVQGSGSTWGWTRPPWAGSGLGSGWTGPQVWTRVRPGPDLSPHLGFLVTNSPSRINSEIDVNNAISHINNDTADHNGPFPVPPSDDDNAHLPQESPPPLETGKHNTNSNLPLTTIQLCCSMTTTTTCHTRKREGMRVEEGHRAYSPPKKVSCNYFLSFFILILITGTFPMWFRETSELLLMSSTLMPPGHQHEKFGVATRFTLIGNIFSEVWVQLWYGILCPCYPRKMAWRVRWTINFIILVVTLQVGCECESRLGGGLVIFEQSPTELWQK